MEQTHSEGAHGLKTGLGVHSCEICPEATGPLHSSRRPEAHSVPALRLTLTTLPILTLKEGG